MVIGSLDALKKSLKEKETGIERRKESKRSE